MIVFGSAMTDPEAYRRWARPGILMAAEADSKIYAFAALGSICRSYNLVLDRAAKVEGLEALVLVQQEVEILDADLCRKAREALGDPEVGAVGPMGATGVESIAWWEGDISAAPVRLRHQRFGGGEVPAFSWKTHRPPPADVDTLDGRLLVLSPWAVRNVRFDESLSLGFGYDLDLSLKMREAGRRLRTADLPIAINTRSLRVVKDLDLWIEGHITAQQRMEDRLPRTAVAGLGWKERARRAEAAREAARTLVYSTEHQVDAELAPLELELEQLTESLSWRLTEPLRRLNKWWSRRDPSPASGQPGSRPWTPRTAKGRSPHGPAAGTGARPGRTRSTRAGA